MYSFVARETMYYISTRIKKVLQNTCRYNVIQAAAKINLLFAQTTVLTLTQQRLPGTNSPQDMKRNNCEPTLLKNCFVDYDYDSENPFL